MYHNPALQIMPSVLTCLRCCTALSSAELLHVGHSVVVCVHCCLICYLLVITAELSMHSATACACNRMHALSVSLPVGACRHCLLTSCCVCGADLDADQGQGHALCSRRQYWWNHFWYWPIPEGHEPQDPCHATRPCRIRILGFLGQANG